MRSQSQRVPIISPLEKNYELRDNQNELNFSDDNTAPSFADAKLEAADLVGNKYSRPVSIFKQNLTNDSLSPETLIHEDRALSSSEHQHFTIVGERDIGGGSSLDEAQVTHLKPADGKPSDGKVWDESQSQASNQQPLVFSPRFREKSSSIY